MATAVAICGVILSVRLPRLLAPVALAERAFSFVAAIVVLTIRDLPERKIAKLTLLCFLPWVGACVVLWFTERIPVAACGNGERCRTGLFARVAALASRMSGIGPVRAETMAYFPVGEEMRRALISDLKQAKTRIWLEYYIIAQGKFWNEILAILEEKARDGTDVRLLYDDFGCSFSLPRKYASEMEKRGIRTAVSRRIRFSRGVTRRDHRKLCLIDDVCYTGGINLADEYVGELIRFGHWKDSAVRLKGDMAAFETLYLRTWYALRPSDREKDKAFPAAARGTPPDAASAAVISDPSSLSERLGVKVLTAIAASAESSLYLFTPYLSLPNALAEAIAGAALSGVDVRLMIPHIPDKRAVFFLTRAYCRELQRAGVKVREYTAGFLHAKSVVADGKYALVSSYNLDFRSLYVQAECGVFAESAPLAASLEQDFLSCWEQGTELKKVSLFRRFLGRLCMLFAPLT